MDNSGKGGGGGGGGDIQSRDIMEIIIDKIEMGPCHKTSQYHPISNKHKKLQNMNDMIYCYYKYDNNNYTNYTNYAN